MSRAFDLYRAERRKDDLLIDAAKALVGLVIGTKLAAGLTADRIRTTLHHKEARHGH